jgi:rubredoxin
MTKESVFFEEWRKCLQEHYKAVIRRDDQLTERTLVPVLHKVGFTDDELRALYIEATLRTEDLPEGYVPNLSRFEPADTATESIPTPKPALKQGQPPEPTFQAHPAECSCPSCMDKVDLLKHDREGQPLTPDQVAENRERALAPQQKTLF